MLAKPVCSRAVARINQHYRKLQAGYLFPEIARRVAAFTEKNPEAPIIKLGIGDVTEPLAPAIVAAMKSAVDELAMRETFRGYGPERGYDFLVNAIIEHDYGSRGVTIAPDEVFVSDGSKCDSGNIQEIFSTDAVVAVTDPVYPVYVDSNIMAGRTGPANDQGRFEGLVYLESTEANGFAPPPPQLSAGQTVDLVYLCSPNNPTGAVASREYLTTWVDWARAHQAVIVFDAAYEAFISDPDIPHSIYEIAGAKTCAIEMRSFSKRAGFTGVRCAFTVIPRDLVTKTESGEEIALRDLWSRRHSTKFNGASYIVQCGAHAVYSPEGLEQTRAQVGFYMENARLLRKGLTESGFTVYGGENAPYIWLKTPTGVSSWEFFNTLLEGTYIVGTPGAGFGPSGEGFFRLSAFNSRSNVEEALSRVAKAFS